MVSFCRSWRHESQSVKEAVKLTADTTLYQLIAKQGQLIELNNKIVDKIKDEIALEEDISNADEYQFDLDDLLTCWYTYLIASYEAKRWYHEYIT